MKAALCGALGAILVILAAVSAMAAVPALVPAASTPLTLSSDLVVKLVCIGEKSGTGTGTRVGPNLILTAAHVSNGRHCLANGEPVEQVEVSPGLDFALLRSAPAERWIPIKCQRMTFGSAYTAWGYARGGPLYRQEAFGTLFHPLSIQQSPGFGRTGIFVGHERFIPGMSGGPILNVFGQLVGIVIGYHPLIPASYGRLLTDTHLCGAPA